MTYLKPSTTMSKTTIKKLATDIATLLGESLAPEVSGSETPFPGIEVRVRILAPSFLAEIIRREAEENGVVDIPDEHYGELTEKILQAIRH